MSQNIQFVRGERIRTFGGWYEHTKVRVGDRLLEGSIQHKRQNKRTTVITIFRDMCIMGQDWEWLMRQNEEADKAEAA
jgi:hypothetical protein